MLYIGIIVVTNMSYFWLEESYVSNLFMGHFPGPETTAINKKTIPSGVYCKRVAHYTHLASCYFSVLFLQ